MIDRCPLLSGFRPTVVSCRLAGPVLFFFPLVLVLSRHQLCYFVDISRD
jgi:hypothetical protein